MTAPRQYTDATDPNLAQPNSAYDDQTRYPADEFGEADRAAGDPAAQQQWDQQAASTTPPAHGDTNYGDSNYGAPADGAATQGSVSQSQGTQSQSTQSPSTGATSTGAASTGDALFAEQDLSELRARWNDVQAAFVDDPRACVQKADGLVSSAVEQLTANFSNTRSRLEEQWSRGEEASTEDLRVALKRYRDFFDRLLAV